MTSAFEVVLQGDSMWPTFVHGDVLCFEPLKKNEPLLQGDVVLAAHPLKAEVLMVKRIRRVLEGGDLFLVGDQPDPTASEDSHNFGPVRNEAVLGKWNGEVKRA
jgi:nickel-type superoxide dismutase maturation protease